MSNLGSDFVLAEILPRLPAKSLISFKCVSKSFKSVISSSDFVKLYLRHNALSSPDILVIPGENSITCYNLDSTTAISTLNWHDSASIYIVGSSNGLLCIFINYNGLKYFCVLNPTTQIRQYIYVPDYGETGFNIGFAFDTDNLDFRIVGFSNQPREGEIKTMIIKVYSLNTNSWTEIQTNLPGDEIHNSGGMAPFYNNLLHWMLWSVTLRKYRIGCFNICKNKWVDDVLLPHYYYNTVNNSFFCEIGFFDGSLFASFGNKVDSCFDVWVMKEYGVQDSWFKMLTIPVSDNLPNGMVPVACHVGSSQVLIQLRYTVRLLWYDKSDGELSEANFERAYDLSMPQICMCSTSLVAIPNGQLFGVHRDFLCKLVYDLLDF